MLLKMQRSSKAITSMTKEKEEEKFKSYFRD